MPYPRQIFLGMLPVAVDCSFPGGIAMRYALSVSGLVDDVKFSHYGGVYNSKNSRSSDIIGFRAHHGGSSCYVHTTRNWTDFNWLETVATTVATTIVATFIVGH